MSEEYILKYVIDEDTRKGRKIKSVVDEAAKAHRGNISVSGRTDSGKNKIWINQKDTSQTMVGTLLGTKKDNLAHFSDEVPSKETLISAISSATGKSPTNNTTEDKSIKRENRRLKKNNKELRQEVSELKSEIEKIERRLDNQVPQKKDEKIPWEEGIIDDIEEPDI